MAKILIDVPDGLHCYKNGQFVCRYCKAYAKKVFCLIYGRWVLLSKRVSDTTEIKKCQACLDAEVEEKQVLHACFFGMSPPTKQCLLDVDTFCSISHAKKKEDCKYWRPI